MIGLIGIGTSTVSSILQIECYRTVDVSTLGLFKTASLFFFAEHVARRMG